MLDYLEEIERHHRKTFWLWLSVSTVVGLFLGWSLGGLWLGR